MKVLVSNTCNGHVANRPYEMCLGESVYIATPVYIVWGAGYVGTPAYIKQLPVGPQ